MTVLGATDFGDSLLSISVDHDPKIVATDAPKGSIIIDSNGNLFRKSDSGLSTNVGLICLIKTGTYTGDGTTSQDITGLGFTPKYVRIWRSRTGASQNTNPFETTDGLVDNHVDGLAVDLSAANMKTATNAIAAIISDGFRVDDDDGNSHPNQSGVVYEYLAIG